MVNIKSAEKRMRRSEKRRRRNRAVRSRLRSAIKEFREAESPQRSEKLPATFSEIDRARRKGVLHSNAAARYKSRLAKASVKS